MYCERRIGINTWWRWKILSRVWILDKKTLFRVNPKKPCTFTIYNLRVNVYTRLASL